MNFGEHGLEGPLAFFSKARSLSDSARLFFFRNALDAASERAHNTADYSEIDQQPREKKTQAKEKEKDPGAIDLT